MRAMKDSGIAWVGEIPEKWRTERIKFHAKLNPLTAIPYKDDEEPVSFVPMDCLKQGYHSVEESTYGKVKKGYVSFQKGDILIAKVTPCFENGNIAVADNLINEVGFGSTEINVMRCYSIITRYLFYIFQCKPFIEIATYNMFGVAGLKRLNPEFIPNSKIPIPSETEQVKIVTYIDQKCAEIDALVAAKQKTKALLKERRQSIIYEAVTKGLDPTVPMKDSGIEWLGTIPQNWKTCRIKQLVDATHPYPVGDGDHGMIKADDYQTEGIPYIRVLNLSWGTGLNLDDLVYISEELNDRIKNSELRPNDILIAKTGATIGKTAIVPPSLPLSNTTSHVGKITVSPAYDAKYFFYVMTSFVVQKQIIDLSSMQSTRPELGIDGLKNLIVTLPPMDDQQSISNYLDSQCAVIDSMIGSTDDMIRTLKEYRQSLIYEAVTGKIEV